MGAVPNRSLRWAWRRRRRWIVVAAGSSLLTRASLDPGGGTVADAVLSSHIRSLMPGHLTDVASTDQHNVKPWFAGRVNVSPPVPLLDTAGFKLVGGRLDYIDGHQTASVVYTRREHVINVFTWAEAGERDLSPRSETRNGYHMIWEQRQGLEFWYVSDLNTAELEEFARRYATAAR